MKKINLILFVFISQIVHALPDSDLVLGYEVDTSDPFQPTRLVLPQEHVLNPVEAEFIRQMAMLEGQRRTELHLDPVLCMTARVKLDDASGTGHRDEEGMLMREWTHLYFGELLGDSPIGFTQSHDGHREVILGLPGTEVFGEGQDFSEDVYVGIAADGVSCVVHFSNYPVGEYMGTVRRLFLPDGSEVKLTDNWMERAPIGNREMLMNLGYSQYGTLHSHWLGRLIDVGGGFVKTTELGLVYISPESGWGAVVPHGEYYGSWWGEVDTRGSWITLFSTEDDTVNHILDYYATPLIPYLTVWVDRIERNIRWIEPDGTYVYGEERAYHRWKFETAESFKQGYHIYHPQYGWLWTHPETYPRIWVTSQNRWIDAGELTPAEGHATLQLSTWQGYVGESVVLAWDTDKTSNHVEMLGAVSEAKIGAWAIPLEAPGEIVATMQAGDVHLEKKVVVLPKPENPTVWIDAAPRVVEPNEQFLISWNASGGVPIVSGESQGIFSNAPTGSVGFSRSIPGDYTFKVRLGDAIQTVTVRVKGQLIR